MFIGARRYILPQDAIGQLDLRQFLADTWEGHEDTWEGHEERSGGGGVTK